MINLIFIYLRNNVPSVQLVPEDPAAQSGERAQREDLLPVPRHIRIPTIILSSIIQLSIHRDNHYSQIILNSNVPPNIHSFEWINQSINYQLITRSLAIFLSNLGG